MPDDTMSPSARRAAISRAIQAETGIDDAMIERLVRGFYARVREDGLIGPIFAERIKDWEPHLQRMFAFWSSVALMSGRYHGQPMPKHVFLPVDGRHFDRWLALFEHTANIECTPEGAALIVDRARRIAQSLQLGIAVQRGELPPLRIRAPAGG